MADSEGADPTVGDDDIDLKGQLMPKLSQVDAVLKKEGGDLLSVLGEVLAIAEEEPVLRSLVLGYVFSRAADFRNGFERVQVPESFSARCRIIDAHLEFALNEDVPVREFYASLDAVLDMPQLATPEYRLLALYWLVIDNRIPYYQLPPTAEIPEEEWRTGVLEHTDDMRLIQHVFARRVSTKWCESDVLRQIFESRGTTVEDRNFLLVFIVNWAEDRGYRRGLSDGQRD